MRLDRRACRENILFLEHSPGNPGRESPSDELAHLAEIVRELAELLGAVVPRVRGIEACGQFLPAQFGQNTPTNRGIDLLEGFRNLCEVHHLASGRSLVRVCHCSTFRFGFLARIVIRNIRATLAIDGGTISSPE